MDPIARSRAGWRPLHALLLAALLLAAQALGLAHRTLHHGAVDEAAHATAWLDGHDDGSSSCRLVDQLGHADLALAHAAAAPLLPPAACTVAPGVRQALPSTPAAGYKARGPPLAA